MKYLYAFLMLVGFCIAASEATTWVLQLIGLSIGGSMLLVFGSMFVNKIRQEENDGRF